MAAKEGRKPHRKDRGERKGKNNNFKKDREDNAKGGLCDHLAIRWSDSVRPLQAVPNDLRTEKKMQRPPAMRRFSLRRSVQEEWTE